MKKPAHNLKCDCYKLNDELCWTGTAILGWLGSGVKDINGTEIFEGDILADLDREDFLVVFDNGQFLLSPYNHHGRVPLIDHAECVEVVGHVTAAAENKT